MVSSPDNPEEHSLFLFYTVGLSPAHTGRISQITDRYVGKDIDRNGRMESVAISRDRTLILRAHPAWPHILSFFPVNSLIYTHLYFIQSK